MKQVWQAFADILESSYKYSRVQIQRKFEGEHSMKLPNAANPHKGALQP
jgi:hypothetical protein